MYINQYNEYIFVSLWPTKVQMMMKQLDQFCTSIHLHTWHKEASHVAVNLIDGDPQLFIESCAHHWPEGTERTLEDGTLQYYIPLYYNVPAEKEVSHA